MYCTKLLHRTTAPALGILLNAVCRFKKVGGSSININFNINITRRCMSIWLSETHASEARVSIRESLRLFNVIDANLLNMSLRDNITSITNINNSYSINNINSSSVNKAVTPTHRSFEDWCRISSNVNLNTFDEVGSPSIMTGTSCGSTMSCFASIFLSRGQINNSFISYLINGSNLSQILNNPNIVIHSNRFRICSTPVKSYSSSSIATSSMCSNSVNKAGSYISRHVAQLNLTHLKKNLENPDSDVLLPRIFFCSIAWTFPNFILDYKKEFGESADVKDHKFTIIKNSNSNFRLIQGYISQDGHNSNQNMHEWRLRKPVLQVGDNDNLFGRFCSPNGISLADMITFLDLLQAFVERDTFSAGTHRELFGVGTNGDGSQYWPSLLPCELLDSHIIGCGERNHIEQLERLTRDKESA
jgi:hypothetical protein